MLTQPLGDSQNFFSLPRVYAIRRDGKKVAPLTSRVGLPSCAASFFFWSQSVRAFTVRCIGLWQQNAVAVAAVVRHNFWGAQLFWWMMKDRLLNSHHRARKKEKLLWWLTQLPKEGFESHCEISIRIASWRTCLWKKYISIYSYSVLLSYQPNNGQSPALMGQIGCADWLVTKKNNVGSD